MVQKKCSATLVYDLLQDFYVYIIWVKHYYSSCGFSTNTTLTKNFRSMILLCGFQGYCASEFARHCPCLHVCHVGCCNC